jgi:hypothetical protein
MLSLSKHLTWCSNYLRLATVRARCFDKLSMTTIYSF